MKIKTVYFWLFITFVLTGCGAITKQLNTMELMKNYTFNIPAGNLFAKASQYYSNSNLTLTSKFKNTGVTPWKNVFRSRGSLSRNEKIRYRITVSSVEKGKSIIRIFEESVPYIKNQESSIANEIIKADSIRSIPSEYEILQFIDSQEAKRLEEKAAKM